MKIYITFFHEKYIKAFILNYYGMNYRKEYRGNVIKKKNQVLYDDLSSERGNKL